MNKKIMTNAGTVLVALAILLPSAVYANHGGYGHGYGGGKDKFGKIFFWKSHLILEKKADLGLAEDKVAAVENLMRETEKMKIKQEAEIDVLSVDIRAKLQEDTVDAEAINKLVAQQYDLKKAQAQSFVGAIASLKALLTKDQNSKLAELCEKCHRGSHGKMSEMKMDEGAS